MNIEELNTLMKQFDTEISNLMIDFRNKFEDDKKIGNVTIQVSSPTAQKDSNDPITWTALINLGKYNIEFKKSDLVSDCDCPSEL